MKKTINKVAATMIAAAIASTSLSAAPNAWTSAELVNAATEDVQMLVKYVGDSYEQHEDTLSEMYRAFRARHSNQQEFDRNLMLLLRGADNNHGILGSHPFRGESREHGNVMVFNVVAGYYVLRDDQPESKLVQNPVVDMVKVALTPWYKNPWIWAGLLTTGTAIGLGIWKRDLVKERGLAAWVWAKAKWENYKKPSGKSQEV